jgi:hypothetical protein
MLIPLSYAVATNGLVGGSGAAYYFTGSDGTNDRKFRTGAAVVEAGWLSGITASAPVGSNLPVRDVVRYSRVTSNARFGSNPTVSGTFVGLYAPGNRAVFPGTTGWPLW